MIAVTPHIPSSAESRCQSSNDPMLHQLLEQIEVATGANCTPEESRRFLMSTGSVTKTPAVSGDPTAQEMECLRQATFLHRLETGDDKATARDLMPTLQRLGYA